jgi:hypothetical protein
MKTSDYETLNDRGVKRYETDQLKHIARLKDIARNLESLSILAESEAKEQELELDLDLELELESPAYK